MLETVGLVSSSSAGSAASSPSKTGRRALGRTASFGVVKGAATGQGIKLMETIRADEDLLRGLGVTDGSSDGDVPEEVRAIRAWECGCRSGVVTCSATLSSLSRTFSDIDKGNIHDIVLVGVRSYYPYREALV
ncbi:hypothetical protein M405DRAFT_891555 [Rhizopogon salebrosus TDB-379]|nr:hypothetical protein M405DRAFT_891555 [Rhizopogon salebrosus TDB-379]